MDPKHCTALQYSCIRGIIDIWKEKKLIVSKRMHWRIIQTNPFLRHWYLFNIRNVRKLFLVCILQLNNLQAFYESLFLWGGKKILKWQNNLENIFLFYEQKLYFPKGTFDTCTVVQSVSLYSLFFFTNSLSAIFSENNLKFRILELTEQE